MRYIFYGVLGLLALLFAVPWLAPPMVERQFNPVSQSSPYGVSDSARDLHEKLFVVDLHADPLLWGRDLNRRADYGQVDVPRLLEGNVGLTVFGLVTKSPRGQNVNRNSADSDRITALVMAQAWPPRTWFDLSERALYQSRRLKHLADESGGRLQMVRNQRELEQLLQRRAGGEPVVGGLLGLEGAHALEGDIENLDRLYAAGLRMLGLAHFFDNAVAGSAHGIEQGGLSELGRQVVQQAQSKGMIIDLAHSSPAAIDDVLAMTQAPVVVSHGGVRATCDTPRNLSDDQISRIADTGGVIGVGLFELAVCGADLQATVDAIRHVADLVGVEYVGIGTDFNGAVPTPIDASGMPLLTEALLSNGFTEDEIAAVMGDNVLRLLRETLPE